MIGKMKDRAQLNNPARIPNGRGGWTVDYKTGPRLDVWTFAEELNVGEQLRYQEHEQRATMSFTIRVNSFLEDDTRIIYKGKTFEVTEYGPHPKNDRFYEIRALEV